MTPEEEIERVKKDFSEHWPKIENHPFIKDAVASKNPIKLGEWAARLVYGNTPTKEELTEGQADCEYHMAIKERERLIQQKKTLPEK